MWLDRSHPSASSPRLWSRLSLQQSVNERRVEVSQTIPRENRNTHRQRERHVWLRSRHKGTCANEMESSAFAWTSATPKQTGVGAKARRSPSLCRRSCMPAGLLLGSFVWLITSPLRDTKPGHTHPSQLKSLQAVPVFTFSVRSRSRAPMLGWRPGSQSGTDISSTGGSLSIQLMCGQLPRQHFV